MRSKGFFAIILVAVAFAGAELLSAQTVTTLYNITDITDGYPSGPLAQGQDGNLYGTGRDASAVFRVSTSGQHSDLYLFSSGPFSYPFGGLTLGTNGDFYGGTQEGIRTGFGGVYELSPTGEFQALVDFKSQTFVMQPPIEGSDGNLYGVSNIANGGAQGTVYRRQPNGVFTTLHSFSLNTGGYNSNQIIQASDGNLYATVGTTGAAGNYGYLYRISTQGVFTTLYNFQKSTQGYYPTGPLVQANDGDFYFVTASGGAAACACGTISRYSSDGTYSVLYSFSGYPNDGADPIGLLQASDGSLYGVADVGGENNTGVIFRYTLDGEYSIVYSFEPPIYTYLPWPLPLMQHTNGKFYGATIFGGSSTLGSVFQLDLGLPGFISFVLPTGRIGATAQILGQGLTGTSSITFNGVAATKFSVASDTYMTAVVPTGATTGPVVVTTLTGKLTSKVNFRISK
jgi:uncharacterized repeat protein (TIGR03803 family)